MYQGQQETHSDDDNQSTTQRAGLGRFFPSYDLVLPSGLPRYIGLDFLLADYLDNTLRGLCLCKALLPTGVPSLLSRRACKFPFYRS